MSKISGTMPQFDASAATAKKKAAREASIKKSPKAKKSPPKLLEQDHLSNAERDELHLEIYNYFSWLHDELSEMETNQTGRRQVSNAGVSVPGLRSLVAKLEGGDVQVDSVGEGQEREDC